MKVSVIIPTYKPKAYIWDCLNSLEAQTLSKKHFEIIIVLNGPKDPYWQQLQRFKHVHPVLAVYILYSKEVGVSAARNMALEQARGEYICFIDDDDIVSETYLQALLERAMPDIVSLSNIMAFEEDSFCKRPMYITREFISNAQQLKSTSVRRYMYSVWSKLIHRSIIANRKFDTSLSNGEDAQFMLMISDKISCFSFTDENAQYLYRQRSDSAFNRKRTNGYHLSNMVIRVRNAILIYASSPTTYSFKLFTMYICATFMGCLRQMLNIKQ